MTPPRSRLRAPGLAVALLAIAVAPFANAAVEPTDDAAHVALPAPTAAFAGASNTVFLWLYRDADAAGPRAVLDIPGAIRITTDDDLLSARISSGTSIPADSTLSIDGAIPADEWTLVTLSYDHANRRTLLAAHSQSLGPRTIAQTFASGWTLGPASGNATLGAFDTLPSFRGVFGAVVVRNHAVAEADAAELFTLRRHFGPYEHDNLADGGAMNGVDGARWMINHGVFIEPWNGSGMFLPAGDLVAVMNEPATATNFHVYDRASGIRPTSFRVVRPIASLAELTYRSPFDTQPGFFIRRLPKFEDDFDTAPVHGVSPLARRFAERNPPESGPPMRVLASANSRGVRPQDGTGQAGGFAHGFTLAMYEDIAGIILRPVRVSNTGPYFGLRTSSNPDFQPRSSGDALPIEQTNFARLFTGGPTPNADGPGTGIILRNTGSYYGLRCQPEPGSRLTADTPLIVRAYILAFPGAPVIRVDADAGPSQNADGTQRLLYPLDLDTAVPALDSTVAAVVSTHTVDVEGDRTAITPGMGCTYLIPGSSGSLSIVESVEYLPLEDRTRITVERRHDVDPPVGATLRFGPVSVETVQHPFNPALPGFEWRGLQLTRTSGPDRAGLVIYAYDAFNPEHGGFAIGPAGWSGHGYDDQIEASFSIAHDQWIAAADVDLWLQFIAHQFSSPNSMERMRAEIAAASPTTEVVWVGCVEFEDGDTHESWHRFILQNAKTSGIPGITVFDHPLTGSFFDGAVDGFYVAGNHLTARGNAAIARATLDVLRTAARWPGDANNDARVDFADLNAILSNFGTSGPADGSHPGDATLDGVVDFSDLNAALTNFGTSALD